VLDRELVEVVVRELAALPVSQRAVIYLRDVRGWAPDEVCEFLSISDRAQRARLHRARTRVSAAVAAYLTVAVEPGNHDVLTGNGSPPRPCGGVTVLRDAQARDPRNIGPGP
jgi:RNA polymerase sigma-70 factor (ECF subfamily)